MTLRATMYRGYSSVYVMSQLSEATIEGLPDALDRYLAHPASSIVRRRIGSSPEDRRAAVETSIVRLPPGLDERAAVVEVARYPLGRSGIVVLTSGGVLVINVDHELMDGGGVIEFAVFLVASAAGEDRPLDARPEARRPVVKGLRTVGPSAVRAYLEESRTGAAPLELPPRPTRSDRDRSGAALVVISVTPALLDRVGSIRHSGRSTANARIISLALGALRRVYRGADDVPVAIPLDLRRYVTSGRVTGNFVGVDVHGTLLASDWSPPAIAASLASRVRSGTAMVRFAHQLLTHSTHLPRRLLGRLRRRKRPRTLMVSVPIVNFRSPLPESAFEPGRQRLVGGVGLAPSASSTTVSVITIGKQISTLR